MRASAFSVLAACHPAPADDLPPMHLRDVLSGVEVIVTPPGAFARGTPESTVRYEVALGERVAGLRLVANTLEFLDAGGAPRLRMTPSDAWLVVEGCAVDTNPAAPWGRAVTAPGAPRCGVRVHAGALRDPSARAAWGTTGDLSVARANHTATLLADERVLVVGGAADYSPRTELYDPPSGTWAMTGDLLVGRVGQSATALPGGRVLVAGGETASDFALSEAELYDPETGTWSATQDLVVPHVGHSASLLGDGRVLVVGSFVDSFEMVNGAAELYDPGAGNWEVTGHVPGRAGHGAEVLADGRVLVFGGFRGRGTHWYDSAGLYDPTTGTWFGAAPMLYDRGAPASVRLPDGRVLVTGGCVADPFGMPSCLPDTEAYDPIADSWSAAPPMGHEHSCHTATLLADGRVLVVGGGCLYGPPSVAEVYEPALGVWVDVHPLAIGRFGHTATLQEDGTVLIAGGWVDQDGTRTASAELWLPCADASADDDDDGVACALDCDDADPLRYPGAEELCDGFDSACDGRGTYDESDADGDGWRVCDGDCDDHDPYVGPGDPDCPEVHTDEPHTDDEPHTGGDSDAGVQRCGCRSLSLGGAPLLALVALTALVRRRRALASSGHCGPVGA